MLAILTQSSSKLPFSETNKIYDGILQALQLLECSSVAPLITLLENQIDNRDICYCTALKIYLKVLTGTKSEVNALLVQISRESPPSDVINNIVLLLLQLEQVDALKVIQNSIEHSTLRELVNCYISKTSNELIDRITDGDCALKSEYKDNNYALWIFGNCLRITGNRTKALEIYSKIDKTDSSIWSQWRVQEMATSLLYTNLLVNSSSNILNIKNNIDSLLGLFENFSQLGEELYAGFAETLLLFASLLPIEEFERYYKEVTDCVRELPKLKRIWYMAHISDVNNIKKEEIKDFCEATNDDELLSEYLLMMSEEHPEFVLENIENQKNLLEKYFAAIFAYVESIIKIKGKDCACEFIESFQIPEMLTFKCNIYFAEVCIRLSITKEAKYIEDAVKESTMLSGEITVADLKRLVSLLVNSGMWEKASGILEKYQEKDPSLMLLRLKVLINHEECSEICYTLIEQLETFYSDDPYFTYCKGFLMEYDLTGSGMELFEKAFHLYPCAQYAKATIVARLNRNKYSEDEVLSYAVNSNDIDLLYCAGAIYAKYGKIRESHTTFLQALINCNEKYDEKLFLGYSTILLGSKEDVAYQKAIEPGTCVVIKKDGTEQLRKIWIHTDDIRIPDTGSNFADYEHTTPNSSTALSLLGLMQGETVKISEENYKVTAINREDVIAMNYCTQKLLDKGVLKQIHINFNNLEIFTEELKTKLKERGEHVCNVIEGYKSPDPGITLEIFANGIGRPYYKAVNALVNDDSIPFWAGTDGFEINKNCILTPSTIAVLASLDIHPPTQNIKAKSFYATVAMKKELELHIREHRNDNTAGVLGFDNNERLYMINNTPEIRRKFNKYFACLNEWVNWAKSLNAVLPTDYPNDIKEIAHEIGIPNVEAIAIATQDNMLVCCDDLTLRKYMSYIGINSPTTVDILIYLDYSFEDVICAIKALLAQNYIYPITANLLKWLSRNFDNVKDEEELEAFVLAVADLMDSTLGSDEHKAYFYNLYNQVINEGTIHLNKTLKWTIDMSILKFKNRFWDNHQ